MWVTPLKQGCVPEHGETRAAVTEGEIQAVSAQLHLTDDQELANHATLISPAQSGAPSADFIPYSSHIFPLFSAFFS